MFLDQLGDQLPFKLPNGIPSEFLISKLRNEPKDFLKQGLFHGFFISTELIFKNTWNTIKSGSHLFEKLDHETIKTHFKTYRETLINTQKQLDSNAPNHEYLLIVISLTLGILDLLPEEKNP